MASASERSQDTTLSKRCISIKNLLHTYLHLRVNFFLTTFAFEWNQNTNIFGMVSPLSHLKYTAQQSPQNMLHLFLIPFAFEWNQNTSRVGIVAPLSPRQNIYFLSDVIAAIYANLNEYWSGTGMPSVCKTVRSSLQILEVQQWEIQSLHCLQDQMFRGKELLYVKDHRLLLHSAS